MEVTKDYWVLYWFSKKNRQNIQLRLIETISIPPIPRNTRAIQTVSQEQIGTYLRSKISYIVGEGERITAFLLHPADLKNPAPAILALHQTVNCGKNEIASPAFPADVDTFVYTYNPDAEDNLIIQWSISPKKETKNVQRDNRQSG